MSGDTEKGKQWIDSAFQRLMKEYRDKVTIEKYWWRYESDLLSYSLNFNAHGRSEHIVIAFLRKDIDDSAHSNNAVARRKVEDIIRAIFESLCRNVDRSI